MKILAGILLSPALISFSGLFPSRAAQSYPEEFLVSLNFPGSPTYHGAPPRTGAPVFRRSECFKDSKDRNDEPMALIPENNVWTSFGARPKFLFYVPENKAETAEFVLIDPDGSEIYTKTLNLNSKNTGTIIQETLPDDVSLAAGQLYTWQFSLICNPSRRSGDVFMEGGVEQVNFEDREAELEQLKTNLEKAGEDILKQAEAYLDAQIDNESISLLAEMRCQHQEEWQELLYWMGLEELEKYSIAKCEAEQM